MNRPERVSVRQFRANAKSFLQADAPTSIGNDYELRAIIVPIPPHRQYSREQRNAALEKALNQIKDHIAREKAATY